MANPRQSCSNPCNLSEYQQNKGPSDISAIIREKHWFFWMGKYGILAHFGWSLSFLVLEMSILNHDKSLANDP